MMHPQQRKRRRGVFLTAQGFKKLQAAQSEAEIKENDGIPYTLEALSERTGLNPHTLSKIYTCKAGVDKRSLIRCFSAFNLKLEPNDYEQLASQLETIEGLGRAREQRSPDLGADLADKFRHF